MEAAGESLRATSKSLWAKGTTNHYFTSTLAFLHEVIKAHRQEQQREKQKQQSEGNVKRFIHELLRQEDAVTDDELVSKEDLSAPAADLFMELHNESLETRRKWHAERAEEKLAALEQCQDLASLDTWLNDMSATWHVEGGREGHGGRVRKIADEDPTLFTTKPLMINHGRKQRVLLHALVSAKDLDESAVTKIKETMKARIQKFAEGAAPAKMFHDLKPRLTLVEYTSLKNVLSSNFVYSGNLNEPDSLLKQINQVAKIDRLPAANSQEALAVLQTAWDAVDIFTWTADRNKWRAKAVFVVLLLMGVAITTLVVLSSCRIGLFDKEWVEPAVIFLSILTSFLASVTVFFNPSTKWRQLRGAALAIESEVWKFRTRTGNYSLSDSRTSGLANSAERKLHQVVEAVHQHVQESASVVDTDFFARFKILPSNEKSVSMWRHGQHPDSAPPIRGDLDDHHSPVSPAKYLELRITPVLEFYQNRMPCYYATRNTVQVLLIAGALATTFLSMLGLEMWAPIVTAVMSALTGWSEFHAASMKLTRYSDVVHSINLVVGWWKHLTPVDRASLSQADKLVLSCEELFSTERQAWMSTTIVTALLAQQEDNAKKNIEDL